MNLAGLRALYRRHMFDLADPPLWVDLEVDEFANDAQMEAVRRGYTIIDSSTSAICAYAYTATDPVVISLDPRIIVIREAIILGQAIPLERVLLNQMDLLYPGWRTHSASYPTIYIPDWGSNKARLYPTPNTAGTVNLTVAREPLLAMSADADVPEIPARHHRSLLQWMLYRGYSKQDMETYDPSKAATAKAEFTAEFGERRSARNEKWQAEQSLGLPDTLC